MSFFSPCTCLIFFLFFFNDPATTEIYTLSLHDALPISAICHHVELDPISGIQFNLNRAAAERSIWPKLLALHHGFFTRSEVSAAEIGGGFVRSVDKVQSPDQEEPGQRIRHAIETQPGYIGSERQVLGPEFLRVWKHAARQEPDVQHTHQRGAHVTDVALPFP